MNQREIESARQSNDQKVVEGRECPWCGNDTFIRTYYDDLAPDMTCTECNYVF